MLSQGLTPGQIARQRAVALATARTQIRQLMQSMHAANLQELQRQLAQLPRKPAAPRTSTPLSFAGCAEAREPWLGRPARGIPASLR